MVVASIAACGCDDPSRQREQPGSPESQPYQRVLKEYWTPSVLKIWIQESDYSDVNDVRVVIQSENALRDTGLRTEEFERAQLTEAERQFLPPLPEYPTRLYYVFVRPYLWDRPHTWNVETDEPNFVFLCKKDKILVLKQHAGRMRDENNKIMPPGWEPPREPRESRTSMIDVIAVSLWAGPLVLFVGYCLFFIWLATRKPKTPSMKTPPTSEEP